MTMNTPVIRAAAALGGVSMAQLGEPLAAFRMSALCLQPAPADQDQHE